MHGFNLIYEVEVPELSGRARLWQHKATGAQLLSFINKDENKVFGVTLRTPPHDSTGLPHILEHSVLCGSDKYPVKEPFVELLKGSLQTFLNAFTYPDKTCYPVASANLQDFYNLIDVYLDAVFHPRIDEWVLAQEGWHLEAELPEDGGEPEISFKGVVYNEMKGVFSSPEAVLERYAMHSLFPDTSYGLESGGDPAVIPELSYAQFTDFHRRYYHPSNARFYFWGDDPEEKRLEIVGELLKGYAGIDTKDSMVAPQKPFKEVKRARIPFAAGEDDKAMFTLNWVLDENGASKEQIELGLALAMLDHILLGMPASPLRRSLLESGLGEDLAGSGMQDELKQFIFSIGLKGIEEAKASAVEDLILATLKDLAEGGVPVESVEAAINSVEFALRENNTGRFPVGLAVMLRALTTWLHSDKPADTPEGRAAIAPLRFEEPLAAIKSKAANGYFEGLIKKYLLDNQHRAAVLLYPDEGLAKRQEDEEAARVQAKLATLDEASRARLPEDTEKLMTLQETPDSPEALASIPRLEVTDLPLSGQEIPQEIIPAELPLFFHPQPTSGICYLSLNLDISAVPDRLLPLIPLLGRAMLEMGNKKRDYVELNMEIARKTGGMSADISILSGMAHGNPLGALSLSGKAAPDKVEDLFKLAAELTRDTDLDNREQFTRMVLEEKAQLEHGLVPSGHMVVAQRLRAGMSPAGWLSEISSGVAYLEYIRALAENINSEWPAVLKKLQELRKILLNRKSAVISLTAEADAAERLTALARGLMAELPEQPSSPVTRAMDKLPTREALVTTAQVNFMGKGINLYDAGYSYHGSALVILKYLRTGYLWEKVRVQGGAYGAMCGLDRATGDFYLASYRDPNVQETLAAFDGVAAHLAKKKPDRRELEAAIVGAIGDVDAYMLPEAKGTAALYRNIAGDTPELRAKMREEILATSAKDFAAFGKMLEAALPKANMAGLGGAALEEYAKSQGWEINKLM